MVAVMLTAVGACGHDAGGTGGTNRAATREALPPPRPGEIRLAGRLVDDARGIPMVGCPVDLTLAGEAGEEILHAETRTDADGFFLFTNLREGTARLRAWARGYEARHVALAYPFPDTPYVLALRRGGVVAGIVLAPDGTPAAGAVVLAHGPDPSMDASMRAETNPSGVFSLDGVPRVPLLLEARLGDARGTAAQPVTADADHVVIHLRRRRAQDPAAASLDPPPRAP